MTENQIQAISSALGRNLTQSEIDEIAPYVDVRNDIKVAEILGRNLKQKRSHLIGKGGILSVLGFQLGNEVLDFIESEPLYRHVKHLLIDGRLDLGEPLTEIALQSLIGGNFPSGTITAQQINTLIAMGEVPLKLEVMKISTALNEV